jgi:hypothetical protein
MLVAIVGAWISVSRKPLRDTLSQLDLLRLERLEDWVVRKHSQGY